MARYIDADVLTKEIESTYLDGDSSYSYHATGEGDTLIGKFQVIDIISDQPTADVEEVHYSEWVEDENGNCFCKKCLHPILHNYHEDRVYSPRCWFCGAKMDGKTEHTEKKKLKFLLDGCDISFIAEAPADITLEELLKQADKIKPHWCACGICSYTDDREAEIIFDYTSVKKANEDVSCDICETDDKKTE